MNGFMVRFQGLTAFLLLGVLGRAYAGPGLGVTTVTPTTAVVGSAVLVTITVAIPDSTLIPVGVNLFRLGPNGQALLLGTLHDDGLDGDDYAGDHIYSARVTISESQPTEVGLQVSAAFRGIPARTKVALPSVFVQSAATLAGTLSSLADALNRGDLVSAAQSFSPGRNVDALNRMDDQDRNIFAQALRNPTCTAIKPDVQTCTIAWPQGDGTVKSEELMLTAIGGKWIIISW